MKDGRLTGARAVVTGGGRGIGAAIARAFSRERASVVVAARTKADVEQVAASIRDDGGDASALELDVTSADSVGQLAVEASAALGGPPTILVNNAGAYLARRFLDYSMADWERLLSVNVLGTVRVTRSLLPAMLEQGYGKVVNVASTAAKWGTANQAAYNVTKHGVLGLTRSLALETAAAGVRVNAVCPGWVATELIDEAAADQAVLLGVEPDEVAAVLAARAPIGRMVEADEVASLAVYLASKESDAMTGVGLTLAGGMLLI